MNNSERADKAEECVAFYSDDDERGNTADLLTDLFHLAKREGWNLQAMFLSAEVNFNAEQ
jgi:hypothetical protein